MTLDDAVADSVAYLRSDAARLCIALDPYWPKWNSPWWHQLALCEAGRGDAIPIESVRSLLAASHRHFVPYFPSSQAELPIGKSMKTDVVCHCALGCLLQTATQHLEPEEIDAALPWVKSFIARYQLPDGGWNCDEKAYLKDNPRSSVVSTVPVLEYLVGKPDLDADERARLDRGITFLLELKLFRSRRTGAVLDPLWLTPALPRFYEYDVLRGLSLVANWSRRTQQSPPPAALADAREHLERWFSQPAPRPRAWVTTEASHQGAKSGFPLSDTLLEPPVAMPLLKAEWSNVRATFGWR